MPPVTQLITKPNLSAPDDFYEALIDAHRDLPVDESHALNARLVLLLANHVETWPSCARRCKPHARARASRRTPFPLPPPAGSPAP